MVDIIDRVSKPFSFYDNQAIPVKFLLVGLSIASLVITPDPLPFIDEVASIGILARAFNNLRKGRF